MSLVSEERLIFEGEVMQREPGSLCSFFFLLFCVFLLAGYTSLLALWASMMLWISRFFSSTAFPLIWTNMLPPVAYVFSPAPHFINI